MMTILIFLFICHFLADFTHLSRPYMLRAKAAGRPSGPIFHHAMVHGLLMGGVVLVFFGVAPAVIALGIEVCTHFVIDVIKGRINVWYPELAKPSNPYHWYVFGADQLLHTLIIIFIAWVIQ